MQLEGGTRAHYFSCCEGENVSPGKGRVQGILRAIVLPASTMHIALP